MNDISSIRHNRIRITYRIAILTRFVVDIDSIIAASVKKVSDILNPFVHRLLIVLDLSVNPAVMFLDLRQCSIRSERIIYIADFPYERSYDNPKSLDFLCPTQVFPFLGSKLMFISIIPQGNYIHGVRKCTKHVAGIDTALTPLTVPAEADCMVRFLPRPECLIISIVFCDFIRKIRIHLNRLGIHPFAAAGKHRSRGKENVNIVFHNSILSCNVNYSSAMTSWPRTGW